MPDDGITPAINKKNITEEITGEFIDFDEVEPAAAPAAVIDDGGKPAEEPINSVVEIIDVGLDVAEGFLHDAGYPNLNRALWNGKGKASLNRALNEYLPNTAGDGSAVSTPLIGLIIGLAALGLCLAPVIGHYLKTRDAKQEELPEPEPAADASPEPVRYEVPQAEISATAPVSRMNVTPIDRIQQGARPGNLPGF